MEYVFVGRKGQTKDDTKTKGDQTIVLEELGSQGSSETKIVGTLEKRRSNRVPVKIEIVDDRNQVVLDLSPEGAFVVGKRSPLNAQVEFSMHLPNTPEPLTLKGTVVRSVFRGGSFGQAKNRQEGMGILFSDLSQDEHQKISSFLSTLG